MRKKPTPEPEPAKKLTALQAATARGDAAEERQTWAWEHLAECGEERLVLIRALSMVYPSHLMPFRSAGKPSKRRVLCIHTPTGPCAWTLRDAEVPQFEHLNVVPDHWDGAKREDRLARLREISLENAHTAMTPKAPVSRVTFEYQTWTNIIQWCTNKNLPEWPAYGGQGIRVCQAWLGGFSAFLTDMGRRPAGGGVLERVNPSGDFEPANCRWGTE